MFLPISFYSLRILFMNTMVILHWNNRKDIMRARPQPLTTPSLFQIHLKRKPTLTMSLKWLSDKNCHPGKMVIWTTQRTIKLLHTVARLHTELSSEHWSVIHWQDSNEWFKMDGIIESCTRVQECTRVLEFLLLETSV